MIYQSIKKLVTYALEKGLISPLDKVYATNRLLEALALDLHCPWYRARSPCR